jgi:hypothetical protein
MFDALEWLLARGPTRALVAASAAAPRPAAVFTAPVRGLTRRDKGGFRKLGKVRVVFYGRGFLFIVCFLQLGASQQCT